METGQIFLYENHRQDFSKSQKLQRRGLGPFTATKRVTNTTYQIQDNKDPTILKTVHRNRLVEYYPKEETLPPMIEEYVPMDRFRDDSYERFKEQRIQTVNNSEEPSMQTLSHFLLNLFVELRLYFLRNETVILAVTLESTPLMFFHRLCQKLLIIRSPISYHQPHE